ncbi:hypothetical protein E1A91_D01G231900v1, partial [Gossypium mustelinum]
CPLSGWAVRVGEGQSLILKTSILKTKESERGKLSAVPAPFEILRRVALWRAQYDEKSVGGLRGGGLPCGGCQRFESAYLQLVNLAETKLYDSTQFFRFGS